MPEYAHWRGCRIMYCTEPNMEDKINSGVLKDLSGGEIITYRVLYSNDINTYKPQFKIHLMTNNAPRLDGSDQGVIMRVRKVNYISSFVGAELVDESKFMFPIDDTVLLRAAADPALKLAFMHRFLDAYDGAYQFDMPDVIRISSQKYLQDNDTIHQFVQQNLEQAAGCFVTLKNIKDRASLLRVTFDSLNTLKERMEVLLGTACADQKKISGIKYVNVFVGWRHKAFEDEEDGVDMSDDV